MAKLDQIDKRLKHSEEDREAIKKELRYNKHEYLDNYFNLARATEEKLQQMSDKAMDRTQGNRVDFVESPQNKRQSTQLPLPRDAASTAPGGGQRQL